MENNPYGLAALWSQGDVVIKSVALLLLLMSIASWYVIATRAWRLVKLRRAARAMAGFWHAHSFAEGMVAIDVSGPPSTRFTTWHWRVTLRSTTTPATRKTYMVN